MSKFSMTCSCGDKMGVEAESREDAVMQMKTMMTQDAINAHMAEKHQGMAMTKEQVDADIDAKLTAE